MPVTTTQSDLATVIEWLQADDHTAARVAHVRSFPPRSASHATPARSMHPRLRNRLEALGLANLYSHQAHAYDAVMSGENVVVVTGTNSGKTLCYNLAAVQKLMAEPVARALYLYPTKALAQDQRGKLEDLLRGTDLRSATYDGDTPPGQRGTVRKMAHIVLSNPDMLHVGILPGHELWSRFLKALRLIVIDEMHVYRGVFGSHVGGVLRRLLRLCEWHNARPQIVACSATIGNPEELFEKLTGRRATLIAEDGAPRAKRTFVFWNSPLELAEGAQAKKQSAEGFSANFETAKLMSAFAHARLRTLAFSRARVSAELVLKYARQLIGRNPEGAGRLVPAEKEAELDPSIIESYRAGYTPKERRQIERALFNGELLGLSSTNAMELGVDIGGLDVVILNGYPGTISSFWQQSGRAGRGTRDGLAVMVAHDDPLEQFICREPNLIFAADTERVAANPFNTQILTQQLRCAAYERPISLHELAAFGEAALDLAEGMDRTGELQFSAGRFYYPSHEAPAPKVNIRGAGGDQVTLFATEEVSGRLDGSEAGESGPHTNSALVELGSMEYWRALQSAHEGAVYLHRGASFVVDSLDLVSRQARLVPGKVDYYTQPIVQSVIDPQAPIASKTLHPKLSPSGASAIRNGRDAGADPATLATLAGLKVTDIVMGYRRKSLDGDRVLGIFDLDLPATTYETVGVQLSLRCADTGMGPPSQAVDGQRSGSTTGRSPEPIPPGAGIGPALHGLEHALMAVAPIIAGCDRGDLGSAWYVAFASPPPPCHMPGEEQGGGEQHTPLPTIFVFDRTPGGVGLSEKLFGALPAWISAALQLLSSCPCRDGCPACLLSSRCEANNDLLDKQWTIWLLEAMS